MEVAIQEQPPDGAVCYLGLGGNVGDVVMAMDAALDRLDAHDDICVNVNSRVYETAPVGTTAGGRYLNAAAILETSLDPARLLDVLKETERAVGRTPSDRWTERVIDLDLLLFDRSLIDRPGLTVPHPHLWYRRFALDPLVEIAPEVIHPRFDETLSELRNRLLNRPLELVLAGGDAAGREEALRVLDQCQPAVRVRNVAAATDDRDAVVAANRNGPWLEFVSSAPTDDAYRRFVDLSALPGTMSDTVGSVMQAALDEPRVHSRPLRRIP
jgi:2-amino-4-hydroxy-6-hydroxymethyldihydropteridine diphosphokinase